MNAESIRKLYEALDAMESVAVWLAEMGDTLVVANEAGDTLKIDGDGRVRLMAAAPYTPVDRGEAVAMAERATKLYGERFDALTAREAARRVGATYAKLAGWLNENAPR